ncbi:MAG: response regulator [Oscillatoria sp. SIO1A7]|nr:response regulator [Oscillatoria sp. SIO1A7]
MTLKRSKASKGDILVIDDMPDNLRLLSSMLIEQGYKVRRVINGNLGLQAAQAVAPDLILLDIMMPEIDGYAVCERLKKSEKTRDIPVIFLSAKDNLMDKVKAFKVGGVDYITKPFHVAEVAIRVETQLNLSKLQRKLQEQNAKLQEEISAREKAGRDRDYARAAMRLSEEKFYKAFLSSPNPITITNLADGRHIEVNESFCSLTGYSSEETLGRTAIDLNLWVDREDRTRLFEILKRDRAIRNYEFDLKTKSGEIKTALLSAEIINIDGLDCLLSVSNDITDRKRAEEKLRLLERAIAATSNGVIITDPTQADNPIIYTNSGFERITGYTATDAIGKNCRFLQGPDTEQPCLERIRQAIAREEECSVTLRNYGKDGTPFWNELTISPIRDSSGKLTQFIGVQTDITELKQTEEALQHSQSLLAGVLNSSLDGVMAFESVRDSEGKIIDFKWLLLNKAAEKMVGRSREELLGRYLLEEMPGNREFGLFDLYVRVVETGEPLENEFYYDREGVRAWLHNVAVKLEDGFAVTFRDISERKQAEKELQEEEAAIRALYKVASSPKLDFQKRLQGLLAMGRRRFGLEIGTIGRIEGYNYEPIAAQVPPKFPFSIAAQNRFELGDSLCRETFTAKEPIAFQAAIGSEGRDWLGSIFQVKAYIGTQVRVWGKPDGVLEFASLELRNSSFKNGDRQLLKLMAQWIGNEIEREQSKATLKRQIQRALLLGQITQEIRQSLDAQKIFQTSVAQMGQVFGVNRCTIHTYLAKPLPKIPQVAEYLEPGYESILEVEIPVAGNLYAQQILAQDRAIAASDIENDPLLRGAGSIYGQLGIKSMLAVRTSYMSQANGAIVLQQCNKRTWTRDEIELLEAVAAQVGIALAQAHLLEQEKQRRSQLEIARREAEKANRTKSDFLAMMSHEIRTPMNAVIGMTELLLDSKITVQQRNFLETIHSSTDALLAIINDILDFSKIESGKLELEQKPFKLRDCLESALNIVATAAGQKNLDVVCSLDSAIPKAISGDVTRLRQIIINLLGNAVKFTDKGEVVLSAIAERIDSSSIAKNNLEQNRGSKFKIIFSVRDTGIGIPASRIDRLFKPFSQVDASTTREYGGTGLGLAIAKRLSEMMGGKIWLESEEGKGSIFYFTIVAIAAPCPVVFNLEEKIPELAGKKLLIVDDNKTNREEIAKQAKLWGMEPRPARSGQQALEWLSKNRQFDLAILDRQMPEIDGWSLARAIRQIDTASEMPLIIMSFAGRQMLAELEERVEVAAFLTKPIKQRYLYEVLVAALRGESHSPGLALTSSAEYNFQLGELLPLRILLVDDVVTNQKVALEVLKHLGYSAEVANNGREALEALRRQPYDLVFMDVQMPEMDGLEATRRICQEWPEASERPWIVAMTAHAMESDRALCFSAGMNDYISKPIRVRAIFRVFYEYAEKHSYSELLPLVEMQVETAKAAAKQLAPENENSLSFLSYPDSHCQNHPLPAIDALIFQDLKELTGDDTILAEIINSYLKDAPQRLQSVADAIARGNASALQQSAHAFKGLSATIGAIPMSKICRSLEAIGRRGTIQGAASSLELLRLEYRRVETALKNFDFV